MHERDTKMEGFLQGHMDTCARLGEEISDLRYQIGLENSNNEKNTQELIKDLKPVKEQLTFLKKQVRTSSSKSAELFLHSKSMSSQHA